MNKVLVMLACIQCVSLDAKESFSAGAAAAAGSPHATSASAAAAVGSPYSPSQTMTRNEFIVDLIGISEDDFRKRYHWNGDPIIIDKVPFIAEFPRRAAIFHGKFEVLPISQLRTQPMHKIGRPRFTISFYDPLQAEKTDIRSLQANAANRGASFQLASTFSAQEGGIGKPESYLMGMLHSPVQGEEARISAAPGAFYVKYFHLPVNLLAGLDDPAQYPGSLNKVRVSRWGTLEEGAQKYINRNKIVFNASDIPHVAVALHKDVVVTSGFDGTTPARPAANEKQKRLEVFVKDDCSIDTSKTQTINQIMTAAFNTTHAREAKHFELPLQKMTQILLDAAYEGTLRAAYSTGNPKIFLTLVGAGAFRNNIEWIGYAIERMQDFMKSAGLDVHLIFYPDKPDRRNPVRNKRDDFEFLKRMSIMAASINNASPSRRQTQTLNDKIKSYLDAAYNKKSDAEVSRNAQALQKAFNEIIAP